MPADVEVTLPRSQVYEITFEGRAGQVLRAEFDDCEVSVNLNTTTLRVRLPDQVALWGIVQRMMELGLEVTELRLLTVRTALAGDRKADQISPGR